MDSFEFSMWLAYFEIQNDELKRQQKLQKAKVR